MPTTEAAAAAPAPSRRRSYHDRRAHLSTRGDRAAAIAARDPDSRLTLEDAASLMLMATRTVRPWLAEQRVPALLVGKRVTYRLGDVLDAARRASRPRELAAG